MADDDDDAPDPAEALARLRAGDDEATLGDVLALLDSGILPEEVVDAANAVFATQRDVNNGGMDQVVWNHGVAAARVYAKAWNAVGAIENGQLLERLAAALEAYNAEHTDIEGDAVKHFIAFRKSVGGPEFRIPDPTAEVGESLLEYVLERGASLPDL